ncbi:MAG: hypothetical protein COA97_11910 [Flavobacteriales bacterium]|nr:MAG: hypothetical protein COA97_11910 [Flavobacteriales bacterium]
MIKHFLTSVSLLLLCLGSSTLYCQNITTKQYTSENGLPSNIVYQVYQDSDKFLWFSTEVGICRYDGKSFKSYSFKDDLPDNVIFETKETNNNKKWFLSGNGKLSYIENNSFSFKEVPSLSFSAFISELIETSDGKIIVSSFGDGIKIMDKNAIYHFNKKRGLLSNNVSFIWYSDNNIYILSSKGINKITSDYNVEIIHDLKENIHFSRACKTRSNQIIFTAREKIMLFSEQKGLITLKGAEGLTKNIINQLCLLPNNELVACTNNGILFFNILNDSIIIRSHVLENTPTSNIILDHEKSYWVSTLNQGVVSFQKNHFKLIGNSQEAYCFYKNSEGEIYIGYENYSFAKKDNDSLIYFKLDKNNNFSNRKIRSIYMERNIMWFSLDAGMASLIDGETFYYRTFGNVLIDNDKVIMGDKNGYFKTTKLALTDSLIFSKSEGKEIYTKKQNLLAKNIYCIAKVASNYLIGTSDGLYIDNNKTIVKSKHELLSKAKVNDIYHKNGQTVISTLRQGVFIINKTDTLNFNSQNGLLANRITCSYIHDTILILGTSKGLNLVYNFHKKNYKTVSITKQDGLINTNIEDIIVSDNNVLLATLGGVCSFPLKNISETSNEIPVLLEKLKVNEQEIINNKSEFSYTENRFSFQFTTITFKYSDRVKTFYRLLPKISRWIEFNGSFLEFSSLNPNNYELEVKAIINNKSSKPFSYQFSISPPYWKTWWFITGMIFITLLLIYWFFKVRVLTYNRDVVRELLTLFINKLSKEDYILVKNVIDGSNTKIVLNKLDYIKGADNYIEIHCSHYNKPIVVRTTLKQVLEQINLKKHKFSRCHKSYIVNDKSITALHSDFIKIKEEKIPISKNFTPVITRNQKS